MDLLHQITCCPNVQQCFQSPNVNNPCSTIISLQNSHKEANIALHQVPEPWSGDLKHAPILFLSSNPSIDNAEEYPLWSWTGERTEDFFTNRFNYWIEDGIRKVLPDGSRKPVRFWVEVKQRAKELLERDTVGGIDYALTEVVHCKSLREQGVKEALSECAKRYLRQVIEFSQASVIVVLGKTIKEKVMYEFSLVGSERIFGPLSIGKHNRYIVFLPHPNARGYRSFAKCLSSEQLGNLQAFLHSEILKANK